MRELRGDLGGRRADDELAQLPHAVGHEGRLQRAELVQDGAERPDVGLETVDLVLHQLWRHVERCADGGARQVALVGAHRLCQAEIAELEHKATWETRILEEQHVFRLDVTV